MIDFTKSIFENRKLKGSPLLVAHRGVCGANIPCNSIAAYKIALSQGADVVEIDVSKSKDGRFYVFHPGMEHVFLKSKPLWELDSSEIEELRLLNQDSVPTSYKVPTLEEVLLLLKDKAYINVDKFWTDVEGIANVIRKCGVEKQVIVKTYVDDKALEAVTKYAPDFMFMPLIWHKDTVTDMLIKNGVNVIGAELLFSSESDDCLSDEYIKKMHGKGLMLWGNSIIYNEKDVISAHHTDDISLYDDPDKGWGWLIDKGFDFIQTDWLLMLKDYITNRK
ncbi:MAG: glycerophosphodiester phosphodiesterase family protein [Clostridia bacterium]|nr:glycerophosphodiester phosphodiesterase family protein [Clostridia bacterium]